ncbi:MAG TPA: hypothetical protein VNO33_14250 [Kofleriaceae bacterium]|nr:hypothetical protein [Kofleriaceae bacterium]
MSRDDRDRQDELDDAAVTPAEQARAEQLGRWLDGLAAGAPLPPAMDSEDRALLETATMVLASSRAVDLAPERARLLVDQALESAVLGRQERAPGARIASFTSARPHLARNDDGEAASSSTDLVRARRRRADRVLRNLPWAVASLAAAAAVVLFVSRPVDEPRPKAHVERPLRLGVANTSRPADPLIGVIPRRDAGRASERLDLLFADRMEGYRDLQLRRLLPHSPEEGP